MITIKKGLDVPISGSPSSNSSDISQFSPKQVALIGFDYIGMKPSMLVQEGDTVAKGQAVFTDKKREGVVFAHLRLGVWWRLTVANAVCLKALSLRWITVSLPKPLTNINQASLLTCLVKRLSAS